MPKDSSSDSSPQTSNKRRRITSPVPIRDLDTPINAGPPDPGMPRNINVSNIPGISRDLGTLINNLHAIDNVRSLPNSPDSVNLQLKRNNLLNKFNARRMKTAIRGKTTAAVGAAAVVTVGAAKLFTHSVTETMQGLGNTLGSAEGHLQRMAPLPVLPWTNLVKINWVDLLLNGRAATAQTELLHEFTTKGMDVLERTKDKYFWVFTGAAIGIGTVAVRRLVDMYKAHTRRTDLDDLFDELWPFCDAVKFANMSHKIDVLHIVVAVRSDMTANFQLSFDFISRAHGLTVQSKQNVLIRQLHATRNRGFEQDYAISNLVQDVDADKFMTMNAMHFVSHVAETWKTIDFDDDVGAEDSISFPHVRKSNFHLADAYLDATRNTVVMHIKRTPEANAA